MESKKNSLFDKLSRNVKRKVYSYNCITNNIPIKFPNPKYSFNSVKIRLSSRYLNIFKINKNPKKNERLLSAIQNNKKLEEKIIKFKINKKKEKLLSFSNPVYSRTINKISNSNKKKEKKHKELNNFSKREINLLDNPNSLLYQLYHGSKEIEKTIGDYKAINREQKIKEYKKYIKKDEEEAGKQLYLLKKDIHIGDNEKISGKIISSNTFFDLKISLT